MEIENNLLEWDIVKSFMKRYNFPKKIKIKIIVTDNIEKEYKRHLKKYNKEYDYISFIDYNGMICVPNTINEDTTLIINYDKTINYKENNCQVICTIFHELIHAKDYYDYYKQYFDGRYDSSINRDSQYGFHNWSEFNAKRISYFEYCNLINEDKARSQEALNNIKEHEIPLQNKIMEEYLIDDEIDMEEIIYNLMLYLGRYSVWEDLFPDEFNNNKMFPKELKKYEPLINILYNHLKHNSKEFDYYIELKKLINYFKGEWVNLSNEKE